ncbi:hypothetical protein C8F01DRAFT_1091855 [Mycena amicta]|nr:hypothetical protein C8F01DRAFT_1091855 [Mycena amicta]
MSELPEGGTLQEAHSQMQRRGLRVGLLQVLEAGAAEQARVDLGEGIGDGGEAERDEDSEAAGEAAGVEDEQEGAASMLLAVRSTHLLVALTADLDPAAVVNTALEPCLVVVFIVECRAKSIEVVVVMGKDIGRECVDDAVIFALGEHISRISRQRATTYGKIIAAVVLGLGIATKLDPELAAGLAAWAVSRRVINVVYHVRGGAMVFLKNNGGGTPQC